MDLTRREALLSLAALLGTTVVAPRLLAATAAKSAKTPAFAAADLPLLDEIGETIIPATDIPGAKAVQIGAFLNMMITDCYDPPEQAAIKAGVAKLTADYRARFNEAFVGGKSANRTALLNELDAEQKKYTAGKKPEQPAHWFRIVKEMTVLGYFSSEIGATQALRYVEAPGRYNGAEPYKKGDRAFFN